MKAAQLVPGKVYLGKDGTQRLLTQITDEGKAYFVEGNLIRNVNHQEFALWAKRSINTGFTPGIQQELQRRAARRLS